MKRKLLPIATVIVALVSGVFEHKLSVAQESNPPRRTPLATTRDQASYVIGRNIARDLKQNDMEVNLDALIDGMRDMLAGTESPLTPQQEQAAFAEFRRQMQSRRELRLQQEGERNKQVGAAFLSQNKSKNGVVTLPSGLQYLILKTGDGDSPALNDTVRTHYHGTLIDGAVFDSSVDRNEPAVFPVNAVIRGWTEALQLMKVGSKWRLFVPSQLAYGSRGAPPAIGPHAVLVFEVELLGIE